MKGQIKVQTEYHHPIVFHYINKFCSHSCKTKKNIKTVYVLFWDKSLYYNENNLAKFHVGHCQFKVTSLDKRDKKGIKIYPFLLSSPLNDLMTC